MDIRKIMDKWLVQQKKGLLTEAEIQKLATEWQDECGKEDLDQATIDREVKTMEEKLNKYNVPTLGEVPNKDCSYGEVDKQIRSKLICIHGA